ncbi:DeoR/GlpR family DNA-binding transcription regulator [Rhodophyticola porphyridii]|uniref:DeoR/GlpR transcriptional regulator n=1 Tax=Rhodophyticola porphyridii TaxID=1852017 RepID=A0A3L9Y1F7_9RHOB|nr:DeoR/GlpR family DNA-binding transcription regulator [Rhodophyticola porphyridii]RMA41245.1 DeoR/GlpR transcriptional regulator [Rhodophyticola porphyridii]
MTLSFRQVEILEIAKRDGKVTVDSLARHFGVTLQTIRRDLTELGNAGQLDRVHGGAIISSGTTNVAYEERRSLHSEEKARIARLCATAIPDDCSVFLNIGTSTEAVASELLHHRNLMVVTNNINVAHILVAAEQCEVILTGGNLGRSDGGLLGPLTMDAVRRFKVDYAVIGCSALDQEGDLLDFDIQEVGVSQAIIAQARQSFLVADHWKFQRTAPVRIASLADLDAFFTDHPLPGQLAEKCRDWGVEVHVTG